jgi:hypothetical protein
MYVSSPDCGPIIMGVSTMKKAFEILVGGACGLYAGLIVLAYLVGIAHLIFS